MSAEQAPRKDGEEENRSDPPDPGDVFRFQRVSELFANERIVVEFVVVLFSGATATSRGADPDGLAAAGADVAILGREGHGNGWGD